MSISSLPMRGEWIEMALGIPLDPPPEEVSLPMRGEWIEIPSFGAGGPLAHGVSPHAGRVD